MSSAKTFAVDPGWSLLFADLGITPGNVLRRAGLPGDLLSRGPTRIEPKKYFALWRALEEESGDPDLPILIGQAISAEMFDPAIFAALCSPNLSLAARRVAQYKKLIGPLRLHVQPSTVGLTLEVEWPEPLAPPPGLAVMELIFWVALARLATRAAIRPVRMTTLEPPTGAGAYRDYLGTTVEQAASHAVVFSHEDAERPFLTADERMWEFFEPELRRRLWELEESSSMTERVRGALVELLPAGDASVESVARQLAVSTRTLQRQLKSERTTFKTVLNGTREALARHYLASSSMSPAEISFLLGYESANSFYRAFRTWTGQTPERVRAAAS